MIAESRCRSYRRRDLGGIKQLPRELSRETFSNENYRDFLYRVDGVGGRQEEVFSHTERDDQLAAEQRYNRQGETHDSIVCVRSRV